MKKIIKIMIIMASLCASMAIGAMAEEIEVSVGSGANDYITFDTSTGTITDANNNIVTANIPSEIDGVSVTSVGEMAFKSCDSLTTITIPNSVTSIGRYAFYRCDSLASVTIPSSVTSIGAQAFEDCTSLTSVTIPNGVTSIGDSAFADCESLTSVTIPNSVTSIGVQAFFRCTSLTSVTIPNSVTFIGFQAFYGCDDLTDIYYGGSESQWNAIAISDYADFKDDLTGVTIHYNSSTPSTTQTTAPAETVSTADEEEELSTTTIPYVGVDEDMKLTKEQALAFAEILDSRSSSKAGLVNGGDNIAALMIDGQIYYWDGSAAQSAVFNNSDIFSMEFVMNDNGIFAIHCFVPGSTSGTYTIYEFNNGILSDEPIFAFGTYPEGMLSEEQIESESFVPSPWGYTSISDNVNEYGVDEDNYLEYFSLRADNFRCTIGFGDSPIYNGTWLDSAELADLLRAYAEVATETVTQIDTSPNLVLDFGKVNTLTDVDDFVAYIKSMLADLGGDEVNDASKSELVTFIENAITAPSTVTITGANNVVSITADDIANGVLTATDALATYEALLGSEGIELNKSITLIIRIIGNQLDLGEPVEVVFDTDLADSLDSEILQIYLGSSDHAIQISADNLKTLVAEYGKVSVQLQCNDDGTYTVNFLDSNRDIIEQMLVPITVFLPCDNEYYTVMARYGSQSDNWGGQYSAVDGTISFTTPFTGIYELLDNSQNIADISELSDDVQAAIKFMISKGFFTIDESENFRPDEFLARQDATKALVSIFFTLDRNLSCDFPDVPVDSYYYSYVASAAADGIVLGYDDGTFGGADPMTTEQLLAIVSRTLVEKKGYIYPSDTSDYLINGAEMTSNWAKEAVALAIREGIVLSGESIDPCASITRTDAALYLYRLFMLLEEVNPVAIEMEMLSVDTPEEVEVATENDPPSTGVIIGATATIAIGCGAAALYLKKRKI